MNKKIKAALVLATIEALANPELADVLGQFGSADAAPKPPKRSSRPAAPTAHCKPLTRGDERKLWRDTKRQHGLDFAAWRRNREGLGV